MALRLSRPRMAGFAALVVAVALGVTGCTAGQQTAEPTTTSSAVGSSTATSATGSSTATSSAVPTYSADLTSAEAHTLLDHAIKQLLAKNDNPDGRTVVDTLVTTGFSKAAMELTPDTTSIGRTVDSIEFSVLWKKKVCLLGQVGTAGFSGGTAPVLSTGKCLVGTTRAIDW